MNIVVFGASGKTGIEIVRQALAAGHRVTAFVRMPAKIDFQHPNLVIFQGDALDPAAVERAAAGQDAVLSALGPSRPLVPGMMETAAKNILAAMQKHGLRRLVATTGAGVRDPQDQPKLSDHLIRGMLSLLAGAVLRESEAYAQIIRTSGLDWTIVRFPRLTDGPLTGKYRVGWVGRDSGSLISRADGADFVLKELAEGKYIGSMPVVSY